MSSSDVVYSFRSPDLLETERQPAAVSAKLNALTALRFVAAALIVVLHADEVLGVGHSLARAVELAQAVSFFFVLSGFILTCVYPSLKKEETPRFLLARFARVWPVHFVTFVLVLIVFPGPLRSVVARDDVWPAVANMALVHAWIPSTRYYFSYNGLSWSISTEFGFYLCFPLLVHRWEHTWFIKLPLVLVVLVAALSFCNYNDSYGIVYVHPVSRLFEFALGMTAALAWRRLRPRMRIGRAFGTAIELAAIAVVVDVMYNTHRWSKALPPWVGAAGEIWFLQGGLPCAFFALLIFVMALETGVVSRVLSARLPVVLGEISFSVYLLHQILLRYYLWKRPYLAALPLWLVYGAFWVMVLLGAHLSWSLVEQPCRRFLTGHRTASGAVVHAKNWLMVETTLLALLVAALAYLAAGSAVASH